MRRMAWGPRCLSLNLFSWRLLSKYLRNNERWSLQIQAQVLYSFYIDNKILITGDTIFTNGVGRPDLKSNVEESKEKARLLYQSLHKLLSLPDNVIILPAHTSKPIEFDNTLIQTTIGKAKREIAMLKYNEEEFISSLLQKIPPTPPNFLAIVEKNISGSYQDINPVDLEAGANRCAIS